MLHAVVHIGWSGTMLAGLWRMNTDAVGTELTAGAGEGLRARRTVAAIAAGLAVDFAIIGMHQYGVIRSLPDLPVRGFDSNAVTTSSAAYPFGIPDSALALAGLGGIIALATAGGSASTGRPPLFDVALGAATAIGAGGALYYLNTMRRERTLCAYCLVGSVGMFAMAAIAAPAAVRAVARWFAR
ncbi:MAG: vitamin K epoxide reductase family protein [Deltaproteobacteria bacterium]